MCCEMLFVGEDVFRDDGWRIFECVLFGCGVMMIMLWLVR